MNLVYTRCTKEGCKYGDVEQSVHRKTSLKPLVVSRGCFKPSGIILIYLPNPTFFFFFLVVVLDLPFTISMEECGDSGVLPQALGQECGPEQLSAISH